MSDDLFRADPPRRRWGLVLSIMLVVALAIAWTGLWYYAAGRAESEIAAWRARQAAAGRIISCATHTIGGYPFRIELRCLEPMAELRGNQPPMTLKGKDLVAVVQIYQPTLLIAELTAPLTIAEPGRSPGLSLQWTLAQASVR